MQPHQPWFRLWYELDLPDRSPFAYSPTGVTIMVIAHTAGGVSSAINETGGKSQPVKQNVKTGNQNLVPITSGFASPP
jgi:hypothetical protein